MKSFLLLFLSFSGWISLHAQGSWEQKKDFPGTPRYAGTGYALNGKGYVVTGYNPNGTPSYMLGDNWEYDPASDSWTKRADFPGSSRWYDAGFAINNKGYICTGNGGAPLDDLWEYDPAADKWTQRASFPGGQRDGAVSFSIGGKGYVALGATGGNTGSALADFWEYDPLTDQWSRLPDFPGGGRFLPAAFVVNNKAYVGTGTAGSFPNEKFYTDLWEYDPATKQWTAMPDFPGMPRSHALTFTYRGKGYLGKGQNLSNAIHYPDDIWSFDPVARQWKIAPSDMDPQYALGVSFTIGNAAYLATGFPYLSHVWKFSRCINYTLEAGTSTGCSPLKVQFNVKMDSAGGYEIGSACSWDFGDGQTSSANNPLHVFTSTRDTQFRVKYTYAKGSCIDSDFIFIRVKGSDMSAVPELYEATVADDSFVLIEWKEYTGANEYAIYKSSDDANYTLLGKTKDTQWYDRTDVQSRSWYYRIEAKDDCGNISPRSKAARTILLTGMPWDNDEYADLSWTPYINWAIGVDHYKLLKTKTAASALEEIASQVMTAYHDTDFTAPDMTRRCYQVTAFEADGNQRTSTSNTLCLPIRARLYIPNAFSPNGDGLNDAFYLQGAGIRSVWWEIYNRWGERLFEGHSMSDKWSGQNAPEGVYFYRVTAAGEKEHFYKSGLLNLIK